MEEETQPNISTSQIVENTATGKKHKRATEKTSSKSRSSSSSSSSSSSLSSSSSSSHHTRRKKDSEVGKRERKLNPIYADFALDSRTMQAMTANRKRSSETTSTKKEETSSSSSAPAKKKKKTASDNPPERSEHKKSPSHRKSSRKSESVKEEHEDKKPKNDSEMEIEHEKKLYDTNKVKREEEENEKGMGEECEDNNDASKEDPPTPGQVEPMSPILPSSSSVTSVKKEKENDDDDEENKKSYDEDEGEDDNDDYDDSAESMPAIPTSSVTLSTSSSSLSSSLLLPQSSHTKSKSKKRGSIDPNSPEWIRAIYSFIKALMKLPEASPFLDPVDPVALCVPDYFDVIKEPMDLGTIRHKIEVSSKESSSVQTDSGEGADNDGEENGDSNIYKCLDDVSRDIRLVFANARKYNPPGHNVHDCAAALGNVFERRLPKIELIAKNPDMSNGTSEYKWLHLEIRRALEEQTRKIRDMKHAEELRLQQIEHQQKLNLRRIADGILTSEQKRTLVEKISKQKSRELAKIVDVLRTYSHALRRSFAMAQQNSDYVVEVDIERLPNNVLTLLWRMMFPNDSTFSPATPSSPALASSPGLDPKKKKKQTQPHSSLQQSVELDQSEDFNEFTLEKDKST